MIRKPILALATAAVLGAGIFTWHQLAFAQGGGAPASPTLIPFQGLITNQQGQLQGTGQYSIIFNLYDAAVGGQPIWSERHAKVGVINGQVNVFLGSINTAQPLCGVNFSSVKYLGITVDVDDRPTTPDPEMVPRQIMVPSFYAKNAEKLAGHDWSTVIVDENGGQTNNPATGFINGARIKAGSVGSDQITNGSVGTDDLGPGAVTLNKMASNAIGTGQIADGNVTKVKLEVPVQQALVPAGTILSFAGLNAPPGYVLCDGAAYPRSGVYAGLFAVIQTTFGDPDGASFNVPDLRGQFLRGYMPPIQESGTGSASSNEIPLVITAPATTHRFNRTGMKVRVTPGSLTGLAVNTDYYVIRSTLPDRIALATSFSNAQSGTKITVTGNAAGSVFISAEDPDISNRVSVASTSTLPAVGFGTIQEDAFQGHWHDVQLGSSSGGNKRDELTLQDDNDQNVNDTNGNPQATLGLSATTIRTNLINGIPRTSSETRPRNIAVNYIIKL